MSQKYVIVHFIDSSKLPIDFPCAAWPLHVTLLSNFTINKPLQLLINDLEEYTLTINRFDTVVDGKAYFGPTKDIEVSLLRPSKTMSRLHEDLYNLTTTLGAHYDEPKYMLSGFRPHATIQKADRLTDAQPICINKITLVDMYPDNDIKGRRIIKTFSLV